MNYLRKPVILMLGPGKGHNVKRFLDYFELNSDYHLAYFYFNFGNHYVLSDFKKVDSFSYNRSFKLIQFLISKSTKIVWVHNWCPWPILFLILVFKRRDTVLNFDVWSEQIPILSLKNSIKGKFYRFFMERCDYVQCHWHSTLKYFEANKRINSVLIPWGLESQYFNTKKTTLTQFTTEFVNNLDHTKYSFFIPKSINIYNRHDIAIEAASILRNEGLDQFQIFIWLGNHVNDDLLKSYKRRIIELNLQLYVIIVEHPFLPIDDIIKIWTNMDCSLQLLDNDQLSSSLLEPMLFQKEIIASDIYAYRALNVFAGLEMELVTNEANAVADKMKNKILGEKVSKIELDRRKEFVITTRQFNLNINIMLEVFILKPSRAV